MKKLLALLLAVLMLTLSFAVPVTANEPATAHVLTAVAYEEDGGRGPWQWEEGDRSIWGLPVIAISGFGLAVGLLTSLLYLGMLLAGEAGAAALLFGLFFSIIISLISALGVVWGFRIIR